MDLLLVKLLDGKEVIINEQNVCEIYPSHVRKDEPPAAKLCLANGKELICSSPNYDEWMNDVHKRKY